MFPRKKSRSTGPGFPATYGRRRQQPKPFQRMPTANQPILQQMTSANAQIDRRNKDLKVSPFQPTEAGKPLKEGLIVKILGKSKQKAASPKFICTSRFH